MPRAKAVAIFPAPINPTLTPDIFKNYLTLNICYVNLCWLPQVNYVEQCCRDSKKAENLLIGLTSTVGKSVVEPLAMITNIEYQKTDYITQEMLEICLILNI